MALNFPSSPTAGQTYTDDNAAVWEYDGVKWNVLTGTYNKIFSGTKLGLTSSFALTTTPTQLNWSVETFDTDSYFNFSNPSRITFFFSAFYRINFSVFTGATGASHTITIKKNGSTTVSSVVLAPNQYTNYDEILELVANDYLEIYVSESTASGNIETSTTLEVTRVGLSIGTSISSAEVFSGARTILSSQFSTTTTPTAVTWSTTQFNQNASTGGAVYWSGAAPTRLTVSTTGYYRIKSNVAVGATDTYTVTLKKNGSTTLSTATINPNGYAQIDDIYQLSAADYLELFVNDGASVGYLTTSTYLELFRVGV